LIASAGGLADVEGQAGNIYPMTHLNGNTCAVTAYPETLDSRKAITFTTDGGGEIAQLNFGDTVGPGTGLLIASCRRAPTGAMCAGRLQ
jgi:hypothetical protein